MLQKKRRIKYIDRRIQGQLAMRTLLHWVTLMLVCCLVSLTLQFLLNPLASWQDNVGRMWSAQGPVVLVAFALFPVFVKDTISYSHRFVGPITRVRGVLRDLAAGKDVSPIQMRPNDHWLEMANEINLVIAQVERLKRQAEIAPLGSEASPNQETLAVGVS